MPAESDAFCNWLAGLIDGEGHFAISPRQGRSGDRYFFCHFKLSLRDDDAPILHEIVERTGLGRVEPPVSKALCVWSITSLPERLRLIEILDGHPMRAKKARDYAIWRRAVVASLDIKQNGGHGRNDGGGLAGLRADLRACREYRPVLHIESRASAIDEPFGNWLAGFADAEGCFHIGVGTTGTHHCLFRLGLRADDVGILHEVRARTGLGTVHVYEKLASPTAVWHVGSRADCMALARIFDAHPLRAKKRHDFLTWRKAVHAWACINSGANQTSGPNNWNELAQLRTALSVGRRRNAG